MLMPGEYTKTRLTLRCYMPILEEQLFTVRENKRTIGTGQITKILKPVQVERNKLNKVVIKDLS